MGDGSAFSLREKLGQRGHRTCKLRGATDSVVDTDAQTTESIATKGDECDGDVEVKETQNEPHDLIPEPPESGGGSKVEKLIELLKHSAPPCIFP